MPNTVQSVRGSQCAQTSSWLDGTISPDQTGVTLPELSTLTAVDDAAGSYMRFDIPGYGEDDASKSWSLLRHPPEVEADDAMIRARDSAGVEALQAVVETYLEWAINPPGGLSPKQLDERFISVCCTPMYTTANRD